MIRLASSVPLADLEKLLDNELISESAATALVATGDGAALPALLGHANSSNAKTRLQVAIAIGTFGDLDDVPFLETMMEDESSEVRQAAALSLAQLTGKWIAPRE